MKRILLILPLLFLLGSLARAANVINLSTDITASKGSATPTLTWTTTPVADSCVASDGWSGSKSPSGTELIPVITKTTTFTLFCTWGTGVALISWIAPTQNTDGSILTDLTGFKLYRSINSGSMGLWATITDKTATTYSDTGLVNNTYSYQLTAFNSSNVESDPSNTALKTIAISNATQGVAVTITPKPRATTITVK